MKDLSITHVAIRQHQGLYSLNDLHLASGGEARHRPGYFLENEQAKELIQALETAGIPAVKTKEGRNGGTYACKELVIAYGAWISAAFHLKVISVFLDSVQKTKPQTPLKQLSEASKAFKDVYHLMRTLELDKNAATISANQAIRQQSQLDLLALTGNTHLVAENQDSGYYIPTELGKQIGLSAIKVNRLLASVGLQERFGEDWEATAAGKAHSRRFDTAKCHSDGTPVTQLKWARSVLPLIQTPPLQQAA